MQGRNSKDFRPFVIPRYLPGQVGAETVASDLKAYNKHRKRVFLAQPQVDSSPPKMNPSSFVNLKKFQEDARRLKEIDNMNKRLVCRINMINRSQGAVDCWQRLPPKQAPKWLARMNKANAIMRDNQQLYDRITSVPSHYSCKEQLHDFKIILSLMRQMAKYPLTCMGEMDDVGEMQLQLLGIPQFADRPKACLEFKFQMGQNLGKIVIETFIDYAPVAVNNFLKLCKDENLSYKNCIIHNGCKGKYFDTGEVNAEIYTETPILMHNAIGLVSMIPTKKEVNCNEFSSSFSITMRALPEFDNKRVVIGRVVKGLNVLAKIDDMLRRTGRPLEPILITKCSVLPYLSKAEPEPPCDV